MLLDDKNINKLIKDEKAVSFDCVQNHRKSWQND